ncbi:MAG: hypothetical protein IPH85_04290 [Ignavibacteria bacterium]|nr:hypothetical protein [Ignavibacteria bacterium]
MKCRISLALFFAFTVAATASVDSCLAVLRPNLTIGEKDLLDVSERWSNMRRIEDAERETFLRNAGYADSTGSIPSKIRVDEIAGCIIGRESDTLEIRLFRVLGIEGTKDENVYVVTTSRQNIIARSLIASLQATCESTFLRACTMEDDGSIRVGQLRHDFDCEKDEFLRTEPLPGLTIRVRDDGSISETVEGE